MTIHYNTLPSDPMTILIPNPWHPETRLQVKFEVEYSRPGVEINIDPGELEVKLKRIISVTDERFGYELEFEEGEDLGIIESVEKWILENKKELTII